MGCASSAHMTNGPPRPPIVIETSNYDWTFNVDTKLILDKTWHVMSRTDVTESGVSLFLRIFEICPETKKLFYLDENNQAYVSNNTVIKAHAARFMQAIGGIVENLADIDNKLSPLLLSLGRQHRRLIGFDPEYFTVFYEVLLDHWSKTLGEVYTGEVESAWKQLFAFIIEMLKEGYFSKEQLQE